MNNLNLPEAFMSTMGLGAPREYYPAKKSNRWGGLVVAILAFGGAAAAVLYGIYQAFVWQSYGSVMVEDQLRVPLIVAFILFLVGLLAAWTAYANWNKAVAVYERGLASRTRKGIQSLRWEDITDMYSAVTRHYTNGVYTGTTHVYTLFDRQKNKLVVNDSITRVENLAKSIEESIFPLLYAQATTQYNSGLTLTFGPVAVSKGGIQMGKKVYPWTEVKEVSIRRGILQVSKKDGGWFSGASATASSIPNLRVLLSIVDQVVGIKAG